MVENNFILLFARFPTSNLNGLEIPEKDCLIGQAT